MLNETKGGKAPGMDGVRVEMLKEGVIVLEWLVRVFNICFMLSIVPVDWVIACMVPLYKGTGDAHAGYNFRFLMCKTGTVRMARQGMGGKICRAPKVRGV